jgi:DNA-binding LacI/PurR family transcriptional regulator
MAIIRGIEHVCRAADYDVLLFDSEGSAHTEALNVARARKVGVHGLIIYPTDGLANAASFEALLRDAVPFVLIDRYNPAIPTNVVTADNYAVGYQLTDALVRQGHRHIATIWDEVACTSVQDRLAGYRQAHSSNDLPVQPELAALRPYALLPVTERRARLASWLASPYRPTAYLCGNSEILKTVAADLVEVYVRVREEVTMASMDDANLDAVLATGAAAVTLPSYDMGRTAMRVLLERFSGDGRRQVHHIVLPAGVAAPVAATVA